MSKKRLKKNLRFKVVSKWIEVLTKAIKEISIIVIIVCFPKYIEISPETISETIIFSPQKEVSISFDEESEDLEEQLYLISKDHISEVY